MTKTDKTQITKRELIQLGGIRLLADRYGMMMQDLINATLEITGEYEDTDERPYGQATDFVWGDMTPESLCKKLKFKIMPDKKPNKAHNKKRGA